MFQSSEAEEYQPRGGIEAGNSCEENSRCRKELVDMVESENENKTKHNKKFVKYERVARRRRREGAGCEGEGNVSHDGDHLKVRLRRNGARGRRRGSWSARPREH